MILVTIMNMNTGQKTRHTVSADTLSRAIEIAWMIEYWNPHSLPVANNRDDCSTTAEWITP